MYNVKVAVSRLEFGPKPSQMEVTNISTGHFVFAPVEGEVVVYQLLDQAVTDAGYEIEAAWIVVSGRVSENRHLEAPGGEIFHLTAADDDLKTRLSQLEPGMRVRVEGTWDIREGIEVVEVASIGDPAEVDAGEERE